MSGDQKQKKAFGSTFTVVEVSDGILFVHFQSLQLQMMTPSSTSMAPSATLTQVIKVNNPSKVSVLIVIVTTKFSLKMQYAAVGGEMRIKGFPFHHLLGTLPSGI